MSTQCEIQKTLCLRKMLNAYETSEKIEIEQIFCRKKEILIMNHSASVFETEYS